MHKTFIASLAAALSLTITMAAQAAEQGHGTVKFTGEIVDAPCSIAPESVDQTVPLGQISNAALATQGESSPKPFEISLEDCDFANSAYGNTVSITFSGSTVALDTNNTALGVTGFGGDPLASNVGIIISAAKDNEAVKFGVPHLVNDIMQPGNNTLNFSAYLKTKPNTEVKDIPLGEFQGITNFTLEYQ